MQLILQLIGIVAINALSNTTGTLKTLFNTKKFLKPFYVTTFIDALIFATVMKQVASGHGFIFIIAFAVGKLIGAFFADYLDKKIALGILDVDIFVKNKTNMIMIADTLRSKGYTVNTTKSYGIQGTKRYHIEVTLLRRELKHLEQILNDNGYENPTFKIREINKVNGKITVSSIA